MCSALVNEMQWESNAISCPCKYGQQISGNLKKASFKDKIISPLPALDILLESSAVSIIKTNIVEIMSEYNNVVIYFL